MNFKNRYDYGKDVFYHGGMERKRPVSARHDTFWSYEFMYKTSEVYEEKFIIWEDKDYSD